MAESKAKRHLQALISRGALKFDLAITSIFLNTFRKHAENFSALSSLTVLVSVLHVFSPCFSTIDPRQTDPVKLLKHMAPPTE